MTKRWARFAITGPRMKSGQVLARPTWFADRGVRCDRPQWSGKNLGRAFRLANGKFGLFGLANTHISFCSVWPIPKFRPVLSGHYPNFGLFGLANTRISVCSVWPIPFLCQFGLANTHILVWPERTDQKMVIGQTIQTLSRIRARPNRADLGSVRSGHCSGQRSGRWSGQRSDLGSVRSAQWFGQCLVSLVNGGQSLFGLANTYLWVWSVWPMPVLGMVGLANTCLGSRTSSWGLLFSDYIPQCSKGIAVDSVPVSPGYSIFA